MMKIKKWILFLLLIVTFQTSYKISQTFSQEGQDSQEIKKVVEEFLVNCIYNDMEGINDKISTNYSDMDKDGNIIDFNAIKLNIEKRNKEIARDFSNVAYSNFQLYDLNINSNAAEAKVKFDWGGFHLDMLKDITVELRYIVGLEKENGYWKITLWKKIEQTS